MDVTILERLKALDAKASNAPWIADTKARIGENWLVGSVIFCGSDSPDDHTPYSDWIVTTDGVRASQFTGDGAKADAELIALSRTHLGKLIEAAELLSECYAEPITPKLHSRMGAALAPLLSPTHSGNAEE